MKTFKEYLLEYKITKDTHTPPRIHEGDIEHEDFNKTELGKVGKYTVTHYKHKKKGNHYTFVKDEHGGTVGSIEHEKPTKSARLPITYIARDKHDSEGNPIEHKGLMVDVLHHLIQHGHTLESDTSNTEHGAHKMLQNLAKKPGVKTHIEDDGKIIPHEGDITSPENQKKYAIKPEGKYLKTGIQHHRLVFSKND